MELFGYSLQSIYLTLLIISAVLIVLSLLLTDIVSIDLGEILNPTLILSFVVIFTANGYLMEKYSSLSSIIIILLSAGIGVVGAAILHLFVFIPLSHAEASLGYTDDSLRGRIAKVIVPIPEDGYGEILIENASGNISKTACSFTNTEINADSEVLIIVVKENVAYVDLYDKYTSI